MELENQIKQFQERLQHLLKQYAVLQKENKNLKQDLEELKQAFFEQAQASEKLQQKLDASLLLSNELESATRKELSKKIQNYIDEIDKYIQSLKK